MSVRCQGKLTFDSRKRQRQQRVDLRPRSPRIHLAQALRLGHYAKLGTVVREAAVVTKILRLALGGLLLALGSSLAISQQSNVATSASERRVALVIGNAAYKEGRLANPVNDARAMAENLRTLGFEVVLRENLRVREIGGVYREFRSKITPGGVALVFYAGHGQQIKGQNYFPAIDSEISSEEDVPLQSLNLGTLLDTMEEAKAGVSLVFLDACRDNPYARRFRSASRGLAKVEAASGTLIHYATKPGSVASDGAGKNGTYTEALLAQIGEPNVTVEQMLKRVTNRVVAETKGKQEPWVEGSLRGEFYFIFQGPTTVQVQGARQQQEAVEQAAAEKAELQRVLKEQQETGERATRENAALQQAVKAQQEAMLRANEQAARDRAELQAMLKEALAKQNALLEAERAARLASGSNRERQPESVPQKAEPILQPPSTADRPAQLASIAAPRPGTSTSVAQATNGPRPGDEWEYVGTDNFLNKRFSLVERVAAVVEGEGVMEKFLLNGKEVGQWVFDGKPVLIATSNDIGLLFASHWTGRDLNQIPIANWGMCSRTQTTCIGTAKIAGKEKISVPAGTFDTTRIEIEFSATNIGTVVVWYSDEHKRVIKQRGIFNPMLISRVELAVFRFNDTIELSAIRYAAR